MQSPPPLVHKEYTPSFLEKNWKWLIPIICLLFLSAIIAFITGLLKLMKSSDAYQGAIERVISSEEAKRALGEPIKEGFLFSGNIHTSGSSGTADMSIPFSGPNGNATAYVNAKKHLGIWHYEALFLEIKSTKKRIDLSDPLAGNELND